MKKIILGLVAVVIVGAAIGTSYHVSKESQTAAVSGLQTGVYGTGSQTLKGDLRSGLTTGVTGLVRPRYQKCPCSKEMLNMQITREEYNKTNKIVDDLAREALTYRDRPQDKPAGFDDYVSRTKDELKDLTDLYEAAQVAMQACISKAENKALYTKGPPPGRCYDDSLTNYYGLSGVDTRKK